MSQSSPEPAPDRVTFGTGQPMLMSMASAPTSFAMTAAWAITSGSPPKSCTTNGFSMGEWRRYFCVRDEARMRPFALTSSVGASPAPSSNAMERNGSSLTPAMGARM